MKRYIWLMLGLMIMALGVRAQLGGTDPFVKTSANDPFAKAPANDPFATGKAGATKLSDADVQKFMNGSKTNIATHTNMIHKAVVANVSTETVAAIQAKVFPIEYNVVGITKRKTLIINPRNKVQNYRYTLSFTIETRINAVKAANPIIIVNFEGLTTDGDIFSISSLHEPYLKAMLDGSAVPSGENIAVMHFTKSRKVSISYDGLPQENISKARIVISLKPNVAKGVEGYFKEVVVSFK